MQKLLFMTILCFSTSLMANTEANFKKLIKKYKFDENGIGVFVESDGKKIVDINGNKLFVPASLTKIITGAAVLKKISYDKKFETKLMSSGQIEGATLNGDLCLVGGGDPSFVSEKMWYLVNEFTRNGINRINGKIIVDSLRFDQELYDEGRGSKRVDRAFDAPISAMSFNWNAVNIFVRPGKKVGDKAEVTLDPVSDYFVLVNNTKTVAANGKKTIEVSRVENGKRDTIIVNGSLPQGSGESVYYKSISNPTLWSGTHLIEFLKQRNISVAGAVVDGECDPLATTYATVASKKLSEMTNDMLKYSNNFVAEMLIKNLAAEDSNLTPNGKNANMKNGIEALQRYLDTLGIKRTDYVLDNVSGLTRGNRFTAKQFTQVLSSVKNDFQIFPEFLSGLPIAGVDGTLKNRLKHEKYSFVRGKTGYLDGVIGLAGYIGSSKQSPIVYAFIFNGSYDKGVQARALFDSFIDELSKIN